MLGAEDEEKILLWFTRKGHHRGASCIYITQILYHQSKHARTISINSKYMIIFANSGDKGQIRTLGSQAQIPHLLQAYNNATSLWLFTDRLSSNN